jgi:hypothetical protein
MKALAPYLLVAALVLAWTLRGEPLSVGDAVLAVPINYVVLVLPHVSWFGIARFIDTPPAVTHAGLLGATISLVGLTVAFECCINNDNALGWAYYWPAAVFGIIAFAWLARIAGLGRGKNA